jgi:N-acetylmuramoyl-L-alanine amidase
MPVWHVRTAAAVALAVGTAVLLHGHGGHAEGPAGRGGQPVAYAYAREAAAPGSPASGRAPNPAIGMSGAPVWTGVERPVPIPVSQELGPTGPLDPAIFAPGACVAFGPKQGNAHETVFLDAGHGGADPGGNGVTMDGSFVSEATVNLRVEMDAMQLLTAQGYRVVVSRTGPGGVHLLGPDDMEYGALTVTGTHDDVAARAICANMGNAELLVGIYMNAGGWGEAGSVTGYDASRRFSADNVRFADLLQRAVLSSLNSRGYGIPDGGVQSDSLLGSATSYSGILYGHLMLLGPPKAGYFTTPSEMPGALIEPLFLTDPFEASVAASDQGQNLIAAGIAQAVDEYFAGLVQPVAEATGDDDVVRSQVVDRGSAEREQRRVDPAAQHVEDIPHAR